MNANQERLMSPSFGKPALVLMAVCLLIGGCDGLGRDADAATQASGPASVEDLSEADRTAIMLAAGYEQSADGWTNCEGEGGGEITELRDLNDDGRAEAILTSGGSGCHGRTGMGFQIVTPTGDGWRAVIEDTTGSPEFYPRPGIAWPDIEIGGAGADCFPFLRWDGQKYAPGGSSRAGEVCEGDTRPALPGQQGGATVKAAAAFPLIPKGFYAYNASCEEAARYEDSPYVYFTANRWQENDGLSDIGDIEAAGEGTWRLRFTDGHDLTIRITGPDTFTEGPRSFRHCPPGSVPADVRPMFVGGE